MAAAYSIGTIFPFTGDADTQIMDIGSGQACQGLILAIMRHGQWGDQAGLVTMVESDERKCVFGGRCPKTGVKLKSRTHARISAAFIS